MLWASIANQNTQVEKTLSFVAHKLFQTSEFNPAKIDQMVAFLASGVDVDRGVYNRFRTPKMEAWTVGRSAWVGSIHGMGLVKRKDDEGPTIRRSHERRRLK